MSQSQQVPEMNGEQAQQVLAETVHAPVFFNKLAEDYGIVPQNEQEALQLLDLSNKLRVVQAQEQTKSASQRNEFLDAAGAELDRTVYGSREPQRTDVVSQAAHEMSYDPILKEAALTYQDAVAANLWVEQQRQNQ
jgi:hypothetical protein